MISRASLSALLLAMAAALAASAQGNTCAPGTSRQRGGDTAFDAANLGKATVEVGGAWAFHPGDNPAWAAPDFDDANWARIETGRPWEGQGFHNLTGVAWYRKRITLAHAPADAGWQLGLALRGVEDAAEVYWNGRLVGSYGKLPPDPVWYDNAGAQSEISPHFPPLIALGNPGPGVLAIRVWKAPYIYYSFPDEGGLTETPLLGSTAALADHNSAVWYGWLRSNLWQLGVALLSGVVTLLALLAWLRNRSQRMLLWLALYTVHPLALLPILGIPGLLNFHWGYGLVAPVICVEDVSLWFLLLYLLGLRNNVRLVRWTWWMAVIAVCGDFGDGALQLFHWTTWPGHLFLTLDVGTTIPALIVEAWGVVLVYFAFRQRLDAARWFLAIAALLADLIQAFQNWFSLGVRWTHWTFWEITKRPLLSLLGIQLNALSIVNTMLLVAILYAVWRYQSEQMQRQNRLDEEFRNAQELQHLLVPESHPDLPGYSICSVYRPAQEVGGDFFQVIPQPGDRALLIVGDVSGKGLKAAMSVALIVGAVRTLAESTIDPAEVLEQLNRSLLARLKGGFATCLALTVGADGICKVANAGHLPPYRNGEELSLPAALPLGLVAKAQYETTALRLMPGDLLTLLSDGVIEAQSPTGELFGFDRTRAISRQSAEEISQAALAFGQQDDITVLTLTFAPSEVVHA